MTVTAEDKKHFCEFFFDDHVKPKHLKNFTTTTPEGNIISGVICKKANQYLGSMVITHIQTKTNEFDTLQFVQAMPKINYYDYNSELKQDDNFTEYHCYEKLDGSCLIVYPLFDNVNQLLEIVPKTRGTPVADKFIRNMFHPLDKINIEYFFEDNPDSVLLFELYGILNKHEIKHINSYIDLALLGVVEHNKFLLDKDVNQVAHTYHFKRPECFYRIVFHNGVWKIFPEFSSSIEFYDHIDSKIEYPTQLDMITALKDALTNLNKNFYEKNNYVYTEGVVINGVAKTGHQMFLKVKPWDIEEKCKTQHGVPRKFVVKELNKYFDEYGSQIKEIYQSNPTHHLEYVLNNLSEEFTDEAVQNPKTTSRIKKVFLDMLEAKVAPIGIQELCHKLVDTYPDYSIPDLMRVFAQEYPEKKRHSRMVYSVLEKMVI